MTQPAGEHIRPNLAGSPRLSESEFAALYSSSYRALWLTAAGILHDAVLADDVVQDAAIVAMRRLEQFQKGTSFVAWAGQIVRNVAQNRFRKERRSRTQPVDPITIDWARTPEVSGVRTRPPGGDGQSASLSVQEQEEVDARVMHALAAASDVARACLLLRTVEGMEYSEIARLLEIPEGTAMSHVHRTRKLLRDRLEKADGKPDSPWSGPR